MGESAPFRANLAEQPGFSVPDVCSASSCAVLPLPVCNPLGLPPAWQEAMGAAAAETCYHRGQWYYRGQPTCVGYGEDGEACKDDCDAAFGVCRGKLRRLDPSLRRSAFIACRKINEKCKKTCEDGEACDDFQFVCGSEGLAGTSVEQTEWLQEAAASQDYTSPLCPAPQAGRGACLLSIDEFSSSDTALTFEPTLVQLPGAIENGIAGGFMMGAADNSSAAVDKAASISWVDQSNAHGYEVRPGGRRSNPLNLQPTDASRSGSKWRVVLDTTGKAVFSVDDVVWASRFEPSVNGNVVAFWVTRGSAMRVSGFRVKDLTGAGVQGLAVTSEQGCGEQWCGARNALEDTGDDSRGHNWLAMVGEKGFFVLDLGNNLIVRHISLKNSHNGPNDNAGTDAFAVSVSSDGLEWSTVLKGRLKDVRGNGTSLETQEYDVEGVGGSQYLRFAASSWFGERAALNYIRVKGDVEEEEQQDDPQVQVTMLEALAETELNQANEIAAQEDSIKEESNFKQLVSMIKR